MFSYIFLFTLAETLEYEAVSTTYLYNIKIFHFITVVIDMIVLFFKPPDQWGVLSSLIQKYTQCHQRAETLSHVVLSTE